MNIFSFQNTHDTENYYKTLFPKIAALALKLPSFMNKVSFPVIFYK